MKLFLKCKREDVGSVLYSEPTTKDIEIKLGILDVKFGPREYISNFETKSRYSYQAKSIDDLAKSITTTLRAYNASFNVSLDNEFIPT